jgi:hypothetical protein
VAGVIINVWSTKWNGHLVEVRNHCFLAELAIDGEVVHAVPGVFRHDLRATVNGSRSDGAGRICPDTSCRHRNESPARFCAKCGQELARGPATHELRATVELRAFPPSVVCRILANGEEILTT